MNTSDSHIVANCKIGLLQIVNIGEHKLTNIILTVTGRTMGKSIDIASTLNTDGIIELSLTDGKLLNQSNKFMFEYTINDYKFWTYKIKLKYFLNTRYGSKFEVRSSTQPIQEYLSASTSNSNSPISTSSNSPISRSTSSLLLSSETPIIGNDEIVGALYFLDSNSNSKLKSSRSSKTKTKRKKRKSARKSRKKFKNQMAQPWIDVYNDSHIDVTVVISSKHMQFCIENISNNIIENVKIKLYKHSSENKPFKYIKFGNFDNRQCKKKSMAIHKLDNIFVTFKFESNAYRMNDWSAKDSIFHKSPKLAINLK